MYVKHMFSQDHDTFNKVKVHPDNLLELGLFRSVYLVCYKLWTCKYFPVDFIEKSSFETVLHGPIGMTDPPFPCGCEICTRSVLNF